MQPTLCGAIVLIAAGRLYQPARLAVSTMPTPTSQHTCPAARSVLLIPVPILPATRSSKRVQRVVEPHMARHFFCLSVCPDPNPSNLPSF